MNSYKYLVIEGNIGAGKTSLTKMLSIRYNAQLLLEEFEDNSFLSLFYKDPERYALPLELSFMADRFQQINRLNFSSPVVADYHFLKSTAFATHTLNADESILFNRMAELMKPKLPNVDLLVYLKQDIDTLLKNIKSRGRSYEQDITAEYLITVENSYLELLSTLTDTVVLWIDCSEINFVASNTHYRLLLENLEKKYPKGLTKIKISSVT